MANNNMEITVKTLDSQNHQFSVDENMTVKDFKAEISPRIGIPAEQQRLIFRGRVLQDEKKLIECNVANNTVHVVIRPANAGGNRNNDQPSRTAERGAGEGQGGIIITGEAGGGGGRNAIIMGAIGLPTIDIQVNHSNSIAEAGLPNSASSRTRNSAAFRLQVGNQMLGRASTLLRRLEEDDSIASAAAAAEASSQTGESTPEAQNQQTENSGDHSPMDIDLDDQNSFGRMISQVANAASAAAVVAAVRQVPSGTGVGNAGANGDGSNQLPTADGNGAVSGTASPRRPEAPRLREMAVVIQDILSFQERLSPYLQFIQSTLRDNRQYETEELESTQYVYDTISSILHFMGHSYHALSDIMCDFATPPETRRLRAAASVLVEQSSVIRATIPIAVPTSMLSGNNQPTPAHNSNTPSPNPPNLATATPAATAVPTPGQPAGNIGVNAQPSVPPPTTGSVNVGGAGPTGQPQINFGMAGQPQMNFGGFGSPQMSFTGASQGGGFSLQDLGAILGPGMAAQLGGLMPMFMQANAPQGGGRPANAQNNNQSSTPSAVPGTGMNAPASPRMSRPQTGVNNNNLPGNVMGMNIPQQIRDEMNRPPFDIILPCHSHHSSRTQSSRPANLHRFVNVGDSSSSRVNHGSSEDFILICADILLQSNLLNVMQPVFQDVIANYLMRGRDVKNSGHIRSCGKSLAKKITPFFESFAEKIPNREDKVVYSETFCNLLTDFFSEILRLTLINPSNVQYKTEIVRACENFLSELVGVFKVCFSRNSDHIHIFVVAVVAKLFGGTSLVFRDNAVHNLKGYLSSFGTSGNNPAIAKIVYKPVTPETVQSPATPTPTSTVNVPRNISPGIVGSTRVGGVLPPKQARQNPGSSTSARAMDEDIDDLLNLTTAPRRVQNPPNDPNSNLETALRNIPSEWIDTVRHDLHRQLGMPDQPPFSPGYISLLSRKP